MKLSPSALAALAFLAAGGLSAVAAQAIARVVEDRSVEAVAAELAADGFAWASVLGDGLQVVLEGEAPTEADRFNAISAAARAVDGARVIDNMQVADSAPIAPPDFALEILRNDAGVSLIGLVPASADRDEMLAEIAEAADGQSVSDLLQVADYPVPEGWDPALDLALDALAILPRAKVSVGPGRVSVEAVADSPEAQKRLETDLARMAPDGVRLALSVGAPLPVIAPFTLRARLQGGDFAFDACSADSDAAREAILAAAREAGADGRLDCRVGLGAPSPDWAEAAATGLGALAELGGGTLTLSDAEMALVAAPGTDADTFDRIAADLDAALPDVFSLQARRPDADGDGAAEGPVEFTASLTEEGAVRLQGRIEDPRMAGLARAFAQARFGAGDVAGTLRAGTEGLPSGWSMRVLAGIEALSRLHDGTVTVTPDVIVVAGRTGHASARDEIAARAIETLGPDAELEIEVAYVEALDPLAALPTPEECLAKIAAVTDAAKITFEPGEATISAEGEPVIEAIAEILRSCPDLRLRIAGYTDSQGREETNLDLSQARAEAVLAALRAERVPVAGFQAQGFGEAGPIASNETEEGREANRRIEFTLIGAPVTASGGDPSEDDAFADLQAIQPIQDAPAPPPSRPARVEEAAADRLPSADAGGNGEDAPSPPDAPGEASPGGEAPAEPEREPAEKPDEVSDGIEAEDKDRTIGEGSAVATEGPTEPTTPGTPGEGARPGPAPDAAGEPVAAAPADPPGDADAASDLTGDGDGDRGLAPAAPDADDSPAGAAGEAGAAPESDADAGPSDDGDASGG